MSKWMPKGTQYTEKIITEMALINH